MSVDIPFSDMMRRVRAGDAGAAEELVRKYEPIIKREIKLRLVDQRIRRVLDASDVCQSVMASFFVRAATGQYDVDDPGQLGRLLVQMARNKTASAARMQSRQRRDRKLAAGDARLVEVADQITPSRNVSARELLGLLRGILTEEEKRIADLRTEGLSWEEVALKVGGTAQARRMQLSRAVDNAAKQLGLLEDSEVTS